jgi:hypothetical protein
MIFHMGSVNSQLKCAELLTVVAPAGGALALAGIHMGTERTTLAQSHARSSPRIS